MVPGGHTSHVSCPSSSWKAPGRQSIHVSVSGSERVPTGHSTAETQTHQLSFGEVDLDSWNCSGSGK